MSIMSFIEKILFPEPKTIELSLDEMRVVAIRSINKAHLSEAQIAIVCNDEDLCNSGWYIDKKYYMVKDSDPVKQRIVKEQEDRECLI